MKIFATIKRGLFHLLLTLSLITSLASIAQADTVGDFIDKYQQIEKYVPPGSSLPITSEQLVSAQSLFRCVDSGKNIGICADDFSKTESGQKLITDNEIPSSVMDVLHAYAAYKKGDVWGVAYYLGEAAVCAVVQVLAGGADICGLIKQLIQLGQDVWNAAVAAYEWFKDVGEAILEGLESVGCSIGLCCCDDPPPPPAEWQVLYAGYFAPRLADGLKAIEAKSYSGLPTLIQEIKNATSSKYSSGAFATASNEFTKAVDGIWTADVVPKKLNELNAKRVIYATPQTIATAAAQSVLFDKPDQKVVSICSNDFVNLNFGHVSRWIDSHSALATQLAAENHYNWCRTKYFNANISQFAQQYRQYLHAHSCPQSGSNMYCTSVDAYKSCLKIMGSVNGQSECSVNNAIVGPAAAQQIKTKMINEGSQQHIYPCNSIAPSGPISSLPTQLVCSRPTQTSTCIRINKELFGQLPKVIVSCTLQESTEYKILRQAVQYARNQLSFRHLSLAIKEDDSDPLIAYVASPEDLDQLRADALNQTFKFPPPSLQPGFEYLRKFEGAKRSVDGVNAAQIANVMPNPNFGHNKTKPDYEQKLHPADPRVNPNPGINISQGMLVNKERENLAASQKAPVQSIGQGAAINKTISTNTTISSNLAQQATLAAPAGQMAASAQNQQVMSGSLPGGQNITPPTGGSTAQPLTGNKPTVKPSIKPLPAPAKPDLTPVGQLTIAGISSQWGGTTTLNGQQTQPAANGLCSASVTYSVQNTGTAPATAFTSMLLSSAIPNQSIKQWPTLAPGRSQSQTDQVFLRPGQNSLTLYLDHTNQTNELNETNNQVRLQVILNGTCQPQPLPLMRQTPQRQAPMQPGLYR